MKQSKSDCFYSLSRLCNPKKNRNEFLERNTGFRMYTLKSYISIPKNTRMKVRTPNIQIPKNPDFTIPTYLKNFFFC